MTAEGDKMAAGSEAEDEILDFRGGGNGATESKFGSSTT